ncbi:MAG TPA: sensor histidine kinase, partial [Candidatus Marinimicrobia bacterium]|nr:sensor histidine kinase [Candidatus Neomarinimicrobiota bacterium]
QIELLSKENELRNLQVRQSRFFLFGMVGLAVFIIVFAIFIVRQNRLKSEQQNVLIRQKLLRSQMNPHFIFNSLASIQNTIISNNPEKATRYLARFSKLVRNILDSSVEELIPLEEEISTIENYLELQKFRYPDKFDFKIEIDPELDTDSLLIPAMLVQPFIENSIEHGVKHKEGKGNIRVRFKKKDDLLVIEVEDDGIGREKAQELLMEQEKDHKSLSTGIILERLKVLNRKRKRKITIEITDLVDSNGNPLGTLVRTTIPV